MEIFIKKILMKLISEKIQKMLTIFFNFLFIPLPVNIDLKDWPFIIKILATLKF